MKTAGNGNETPNEIVHVARECAGVAVAGGVGDVVLQLAVQCVRQGFDTTIVVPHYGPFSEESLDNTAVRLARALQAGEAKVEHEAVGDFLIDMAYADSPARRERVAVHSVVLRSTARLRLALICAERFAGKDKPYRLHAAAKRRSFACLDAQAETFCGAEPPAAGCSRGGRRRALRLLRHERLLQKAALNWPARLGLRKPAFHCHDAHARAAADAGPEVGSVRFIRGQPICRHGPQLRNRLPPALPGFAIRGGGHRSRPARDRRVRHRGRIRSLGRRGACTPTI